MRCFSVLSTILLLTASVQAFAAPADQSWTCVRNERATQKRVEVVQSQNPKKRFYLESNSDLGAMIIKGLKIEIKNGKLADGQIIGWENNDDWKFNEPSPEGHSAPSYEALIEPTRAASDIVVINVNSDGWDHYNYRVSLNTKTGEALVDEAIQEDCRNPAARVGFLSCQRSR